MLPTNNNLLVRLLKWARRQEENFLTEALTHLLEAFRQAGSPVCCELVDLLTGGKISISSTELATLEFSTQVVESLGRPDLVIRHDDKLVYVEVKKEAKVREDQLQAYRTQLNAFPELQTGLSLLTRYPLIASVKSQVDTHIRWYHLYDVLESHLQNNTISDPVLMAIANQFNGLLIERGLKMTQVSWELSAGLKALANLQLLLAEAASSLSLPATTFTNKYWSGIKFGKDKEFWAGIDFESPTILGVGTLRSVADTDEAEKLGLAIYGDEQAWQSVDLESEQVHFFARSRASQLRFLETYLKDAMVLLKKLKLKDQSEPTESDDE